MNNCVIKDCKESQYGKGLCNRHYASAYYYISRKRTTWMKLEKGGFAVLKKRERRVPVSPIGDFIRRSSAK